MNRQRCEERARARGWVPTAKLTTLEDQVTSVPTRTTRACGSPSTPAVTTGGVGGVEGHVFLFGAFLRQCLLVHLATRVPSGKDEESSRPALRLEPRAS